MKILVIQLARFGDIYQTWPTLKGLKRLYPDSDITFLVREKFVAATEGLSSIAKVVTFDTAHILSPVLFEAAGENEASSRLEKFLGAHEGQYDQIINLSFSPFSSYLVDALKGPHTTVRGYARACDGALSIPDDASAYFYAQAGTHRKNRIHITDLFGMIGGVNLEPLDFDANIEGTNQDIEERTSIVVQIGASTAQKTLTASMWTKVIHTLSTNTTGTIYIVGSREDKGIPISIHGLKNVKDVRGATSLRATFALIAQARLVVAPDSVTVHMAALAHVPVLQYSVGSVRFWETGPRTLGSRIVRSENPEHDEAKILGEIPRLLTGAPPLASTFEATGDSGVIYSGQTEFDDSIEFFSWELIKALYMDNAYPAATDKRTELAFMRLTELVDLGLEQLQFVKRPQSQQIAFKILNEIDGLMDAVSELDIRVRPMVNWFLTQKIRIAPGPFETVLAETEAVFQDLQTILSVYNRGIEWNAELPKDMTWKP